MREPSPPPDPRCLAFCEQFNRRAFFDAHAALEPLWLERRREHEGDFYKGLIQVAGALVHLEKGRPAPALALLARANILLEPYAPATCGFRVDDLLGEIRGLQAALLAGKPAEVPVAIRLRPGETFGPRDLR